MATARGYRSKIEVLRDFLRAAAEPSPKTRIIGIANLNPLSFRRYLRICADRNLIAVVSGGYVATPKAANLLDVIDGLILRTGDLERTLAGLERGSPETRGANGGTSTAFRQIYRRAWNEIVLRLPDPPNGGLNRALTVHDTARSGGLMLSGAGTPAPGGAEAPVTPPSNGGSNPRLPTDRTRRGRSPSSRVRPLRRPRQRRSRRSPAKRAGTWRRGGARTISSRAGR